jgi:hypothetical protein
MKKNNFCGIHRNVMATVLQVFLRTFSTTMVYSVMPLFLMSIGASKTTISLIEGIAESTAALLKPLRVLERQGWTYKTLHDLGYGNNSSGHAILFSGYRTHPMLILALRASGQAAGSA